MTTKYIARSHRDISAPIPRQSGSAADGTHHLFRTESKGDEKPHVRRLALTNVCLYAHTHSILCM